MFGIRRLQSEGGRLRAVNFFGDQFHPPKAKDFFPKALQSRREGLAAHLRLIEPLGNFGVKTNGVGKDNVGARRLPFQAGGNVDGGAEIVQTVVKGDSNTRTGVNADFQVKGLHAFWRMG